MFMNWNSESEVTRISFFLQIVLKTNISLISTLNKSFFIDLLYWPFEEVIFCWNKIIDISLGNLLWQKSICMSINNKGNVILDKKKIILSFFQIKHHFFIWKTICKFTAELASRIYSPQCFIWRTLFYNYIKRNIKK